MKYIHYVGVVTRNASDSVASVYRQCRRNHLGILLIRIYDDRTVWVATNRNVARVYQNVSPASISRIVRHTGLDKVAPESWDSCYFYTSPDGRFLVQHGFDFAFYVGGQRIPARYLI